MINQLEEIITNYKQISDDMSKPDIVNDIKKYSDLAKEHRRLSPIIELAEHYISTHSQIQEDEDIMLGNDVELKTIAKEELDILNSQIEKLEKKLKILLLPHDPNDDKNTILEIRSGTGGNEASIFANDIFRMYIRFAELKKWKYEILSLNDNEGGGIKEAILSIQGDGAFGLLKYESGVHRVQRIPETESNGRIHTSAATVAVLPEAEDVDIQIHENDIKIDTYRASGAGGQHVNKTESAIRITHKPSNIVVTCQDESSQHKNRDKALKVLRTRLFDQENERRHKERSDQRKTMVSTGDRSAKIRTYNFPQGRITDHRINLTLYKLQDVLNGSLTELLDALKLEEQKTQLQEI